ncbi:MAG: protein kinase [Clostridiales bacterium]|nr:protein kinase [Clostridiales bacterium]
MPDIKDIIEDVILKDVKQPLWENWYIKEKIGSGAFAIVYRIEAQRPGRVDSSALKIEVVTTEDQLFADNERKESFLAQKQAMVENETQMMVNLRDCPYIVRYEDETMKELYIDGQFEGYYYLIRMELLSGVTDLMRKRAFDYSESNIRKLAEHIGGGLKAAHDKGIIHRDIKPGNFFVSENGIYKLGDFNIAKQAASTRSFAGTDYYMAPEVFRAKTHAEVRYTKQADIYSLGICLYQMMNKGLLPFEDELPTEDAIDKRLNGAPLPPPCNASPEFARIILKACECSTGARYRTIDEFLADLQCSENGESVTAYEPIDQATTYIGASDEAVPSEVPQQVSQTAPAPASFKNQASSKKQAAVKPSSSAKSPKAAPVKGEKSKPTIKPVILIGAFLAAILLFVAAFASLRSISKKGMIQAATAFGNAVASADADKVFDYTADDDLEDTLNQILNFGSTSPYSSDRARFYSTVAQRSSCTIDESTAKMNMAGNEGSVVALFEIPEYNRLLNNMSNIHSIDQLISSYMTVNSNEEIKVTLKLRKIDGIWLIVNTESVLDEALAYIDRDFVITSPLVEGLSETRWYFEDGDHYYNRTTGIDFDLVRSDFSLDWSGVYYTVERDGVEVYRSGHGEYYGYYGSTEDAEYDSDGYLIPGEYRVTFYDGNNALIATDAVTVD